MSSTKPLDVAILAALKPYQEYGEKYEGPTKDWSCYILAEAGEIFSVRCTNTTKKLLAVRISIDACYIQQYLLRPKGETGDTVTCHGTGSHSMMFHLVSALARVGNKHSRSPSETGCIKVTVYQPSGAGSGLPPPEKPTEGLELPLTGPELAVGDPSPHAAAIGRVGWKQFASLNFNYRTEDELFSGRIRGIEIPMKQGTPVPSTGKRRRGSMGDDTSRKRQDQSLFNRERKAHTFTTKVENPAPSTSDQPESSTEIIRIRLPRNIPLPPRRTVWTPKSFKSPPSEGSLPTSPNPKLEGDTTMAPPDEPTVTSPEPPPFIPWPPNDLRAGSDAPNSPLQNPVSQPSTELPPSDPPATRATEPVTEVVRPIVISTEFPPPPLPPQPQPPHSVVVPTITPPPTPYNNSKLEKSAATSISGVDREVATLSTFLDEVSPSKPLGFSAKDLEEVGISTLAELKIIARKPEAFRPKISVLADFRERNEYLWMMFRKGLRTLLEGEHREPSVDNLDLEGDPITKFVRSLGGGECVDSDGLVNGLKGAGISSQQDLLVLSRNLERYTENIRFLREFAGSGKFGWTIFQVGLEGLPGQKPPTSVQAQDHGANGGGHAYIKWFLDTIDPDKPLGHLAGGFIKAGLTDRIGLLHVAEDIELAVDAMPFVRGLALGDQLVWAMILFGLENLAKST